MKRIGITITALALVGLTSAFITPGNDILEIGTPAPATDTKMKSVKGDMISLADVKGENGVLVVFSCNTCPFVVGSPGYGDGWEGRYNAVYDEAEKAGVGMIIVNSNEAKREGADSFEAMEKKASDQKYKAHYVVDENSALADAFGAKTTPHVFLFDGDMKLIYRGAIDDSNESPEKVTETWLQNALKLTGEGNTAGIDPNSTRQMGCSIKRKK